MPGQTNPPLDGVVLSGADVDDLVVTTIVPEGVLLPVVKVVNGGAAISNQTLKYLKH